MAKFCELCAKQTIAGRYTRQHHSIQWKYKARRALRTFKPNLRKVKLLADGKPVKAKVCMKCYKRLRKNAVQEPATK